MNQLTILQINDTHSYLDVHPEIFYGPGGLGLQRMGGFARIAALAERFREETKGRMLFFDNGDTFHGTYEAVSTRGEIMIPVLNRLRLDAMTFHWDIAYGPARLKEIAGRLNYPVLAANVRDKQTGHLFFAPSRILLCAGLHVGVIGLASNIIDKTMPPKFSEGLAFTLGLKELPFQIRQLKAQGAELIVLLSHLGYPQDMELLRRVSGVDLCLSGHTHNRLQEPVRINGAHLIQSGSHGSFVGRLDIGWADGAIRHLGHRLIPVTEDLEEEPSMKQTVDDLLAPFEWLAEEAGTTQVLLHRATALESPMDNLLLEAIRDAAGTQLAFSNGWRYGVPIPPGPLSLRDLYQIIPGDPPVSTVELTGREIWDMLEENLEHTFARDSFDQMGGYLKRALGLKAMIKLENPAGSRIQALFLEGEPFDPSRIYTAAFVTEQGVPSRYGRQRQHLSLSAVEALRGYLKKTSFKTALAGTFIMV